MSPLPAEVAGHSEFLETADRIAHRICRDAVWAADACTWLEWATLKTNNTSEPVFATVSSYLYQGTAGIALFLTRYFESRPSRQLEVVIRGAMEHALASLPSSPLSEPGFYHGADGICFAAIEAGVALADEQLIERGLSQLCKRAENELPATALDIIDGRAGLIPMLLQVGRRFDRETLLASAVQQGEQLLQLADKADDGWSWPTMPLLANKNLTGFSHGTAGIAAALLEVHHHTGDARFLRGAREGWRYERTHFCRERNNWPDFRIPMSDDNRPQFQGNRFALAWCHGAVGIGFSRLRAWELGHHDDELADEIESALAATREWLELHAEACTDFSPCHGVAGNAELFVAASQILNQPEHYEFAAAVGRCAGQHFEHQGQPWPCGGSSVGETPTLMLGLAGIGMFYLRLHAPEHVESALLIRSSLTDHSADASPRQ